MKFNAKKLQLLTSRIKKFSQERGWKPVAQDIAKSIVLESAELLEHFQWDASSRRLKTKTKGKDLKELQSEAADIFWYLSNFCDETGIDLVKALEIKLKHNEEKYPKEMFNGKHNPEFYKSQKRKYRLSKAK